MKYSILFLALAVLVVLVAFSSCKKEDFKVIDEELIQAYILENNLTTTKTTAGLHYVINTPGAGGSPSVTATVDVDYSGYFMDGFVFDSGNAVVLSLSNVIAGWQEGIPKLQKGGSAKLLIPSHLAYGARGSGSVPPNTVIIFDVVLNNFSN